MTSIGHTGCLQSKMFFTQLVLYVGSLKKKWQQEEQSKSQPFFSGSQLLREGKNGKQYLKIGKVIHRITPFNSDISLLLLILDHDSTAGK